jgi:cell division protein FtsB
MHGFSRLAERCLPLVVLGVSAISVPWMILSASGVPRLRALADEKTQVDLEISRLGDDIRKLRVEVRHIKDDPAKIEQVARDQLGLLRQTEIVFQFN